MIYRNQVVLVLCSACLLALWEKPATAQRREGMVESILRNVIEARLERERRKAQEEQRRLAEARKKAGEDVKPDYHPPTVARTSPRMVSYRRMIQEYGHRADWLVDHLESSATRIAGIRPLLSQAVKVKMQADLIDERTQHSVPPGTLTREYRSLDRQWRNLSYQLRRVRGLDPVCLRCIDQLDAYSDDFCDLLAIEPQFDRDLAIEATIMATAYINSLLEDIESNFSGTKGLAALITEGRRLEEQTRRLSGLIWNDPYDEVVPKYAAYVAEWRKYSLKLYPYRKPFVARRLSSIRGCHQRVFELLWVPPSFDQDYLVYVSQLLSDEFDGLLDSMTVKTLVSLSPVDQDLILQLARKSSEDCRQYCETAKKNPTLQDLTTQFRRLDAQWTQLARHLKQADAQAVADSRRAVADYHREIREVLGLPQTLDYRRAVQLAAALDDLSGHMHYVVHRYSPYYRSTSFRSRAAESAAGFRKNSEELHKQLSQHAEVAVAQERCGNVLSSWQSMDKVINELPQQGLSASRSQYVQETRQELLPVIAELASMLGY